MVEIEYDEDKLWDPEERQKYMDALPEMTLFEDHLVEGDVMVDAIQALIEEGETAESLAAHWKNKGNELFKKAKTNDTFYKNALRYYSDALAYAIKALELPEAEKDAAYDMPTMASQILSNRAAVQLELKNYSSCRADSIKALTYDANNVKAMFRAAKASLLLRYPEDAIKYCEAGLALEADNKAMLKIQKDALALREKVRRENQLKELERKKLRVYADKYRQLCQQRGVQVGPAVIDDERVKQYLCKIDLDAETNQMYWPMLFLYEQYNTSDFVEVVTENDMFIEHLANMFPEEGPFADWDVEKEYMASKLVIFAAAQVVLPYEEASDWYVGLCGERESDAAEARRLEREEKHDAATQYWIEVSPFCQLRQLLTHDKYVVPGIPTVNVFVRDSKSHKQFLKRIERKVIPLYYEEL
jgi:hypothetical protein